MTQLLTSNAFQLISHVRRMPADQEHHLCLMQGQQMCPTSSRNSADSRWTHDILMSDRSLVRTHHRRRLYIIRFFSINDGTTVCMVLRDCDIVGSGNLSFLAQPRFRGSGHSMGQQVCREALLLTQRCSAPPVPEGPLQGCLPSARHHITAVILIADRGRSCGSICMGLGKR